jgi:soluble lytic murein transglycosylase-like protein
MRLRTAARLVLAVVLLLLGSALVLLGTAPLWSAQAATGAVPRSALHHQATLKREAHRVWGLGAPVATFAAQVHQESRWRADARSPVGALGLAQFMPATAEWIGDVDGELVSRAPMNPTWALRALVVYDMWLHQRVRTAADECQRMAFVLSAYNGGLGWVYKRQRLAREQGLDAGVCIGATCTLNPGVHAASQRENEHYPRAIFGFEPLYARWGPGSCV